ncbi:unnamed protein product [Ranitomeya imitator]|uniref:Uncharacterized protein n=1 Tax=Ranitomeya imitator TaxID=111125 RepID=A0ABN9LZU0_9NEOB|nr:unnamed protein product [Ranitomeya imitator]
MRAPHPMRVHLFINCNERYHVTRSTNRKKAAGTQRTRDCARSQTTPDRFHIWDKMMRKQMQEYLEVSWEMVKFMESDNAPVNPEEEL